jgi:flagellar basal-body rod protein FlgF
MDSGLYAIASSGLTNMQKLEVTNNNLANVNTPGFKKQIITTEKQKFEDTFAAAFDKSDPYARGDHERTAGAAKIRSVTDFSPGAIKPTGNPMDVALKQPDHFFAVQTPDGVQYTRAGDFTIGADGALSTPDGMQVLGGGGPISIDGPQAKILPNGDVTSGRTLLGTIQVVQVTDLKQLEQVGGNRFKLAQGAGAPVQVEGQMEPGALEMANVSAVSGMIDMIAANRGFEMYARTAQTIDQLNQAAISQVGRSR